jgi:hypothetical protein
MSKVVHLANPSHARAKEFCHENGLRMSDWVAALIEDAIAAGRTDPKVRPLAPKKKILAKLQLTPQTDDAGTPVYAQPPFWKGTKAQSGK